MAALTYDQFVARVLAIGRSLGYRMTAVETMRAGRRGHVIYGACPDGGRYGTITIDDSIVEAPSRLSPEDMIGHWPPCAVHGRAAGGRHVPWRPAHGVWKGLLALR